jgi:hypothetical protein
MFRDILGIFLQSLDIYIYIYVDVVFKRYTYGCSMFVGIYMAGFELQLDFWSNYRMSTHVLLRMMWLLKSSLDL